MTNDQVGLRYLSNNQYRKSSGKERKQFLEEEIQAALEEMHVSKFIGMNQQEACTR